MSILAAVRPVAGAVADPQPRFVADPGPARPGRAGTGILCYTKHTIRKNKDNT